MSFPTTGRGANPKFTVRAAALVEHVHLRRIEVADLDAQHDAAGYHVRHARQRPGVAHGSDLAARDARHRAVPQPAGS
jgi:hypothetical protein